MTVVMLTTAPRGDNRIDITLGDRTTHLTAASIDRLLARIARRQEDRIQLYAGVWLSESDLMEARWILRRANEPSPLPPCLHCGEPADSGDDELCNGCAGSQDMAADAWIDSVRGDDS